LASIYSTEKRSRLPARVPGILGLLTLLLASVTAIPTAVLGGLDAVSMMSVGAAAGFAVVAGGYWCAQVAFRGPDTYAVKLVVGGFLARLVLLALAITGIALLAGIPPARFVLWLVGFYFLLVTAEAWILARAAVRAPKESAAR
jgi:hypothetical protein